MTDKSRDIRDLLAMHTARPAYSKAQYKFIEKWLMPLPGARRDAFDNIFVMVGAKSMSTTIFSCHTDTVHRETDEGRLKLTLKNGLLTARKNGKPCILGADDTAGCWIMRRMILAGVPGLYIFHMAEEWGGLGAHDIIDKTPEAVAGYTKVVAFDRAHEGDVIYYQSGHRTASKLFTDNLSDMFNEHGFKMKPCTGVFTDSEVYSMTHSECTNISVGYYNQHTSAETLNVGFCYDLMEAACKLDWESPLLAPQRVPKDDAKEYGRYGTYGTFRGYGKEDDWDDYSFKSPVKSATISTRTSRKYITRTPHAAQAWETNELEDRAASAILSMDNCYAMDDLIEFVQRDPTNTACALVCLLGLVLADTPNAQRDVDTGGAIVKKGIKENAARASNLSPAQKAYVEEAELWS